MAITAEDFKELLKDEKNAAEIIPIIKAAGFETPEDIQALKNNSFQLKAEKLKALEQAKELQKRLDEIDIEGYTQYKAGPAKNAAQSPQAERELLKLQKELEAERQNRATIEKEYHDGLIRSELRAAFESTGIDPLHAPLLVDAFSRKAKIEIDGTKRAVIIDNGDGVGLPATDFFKTWVQSETGKTYIRKPVNAGAGAQSFSGTKTAAMSRTEFMNLPRNAQSEFIKTGGKITD